MKATIDVSMLRKTEGNKFRDRRGALFCLATKRR
jgi:hypothetical protein